MVRKLLTLISEYYLSKLIHSFGHFVTFRCIDTCCRWKYVITGILEVDVKPRLQMWSWQHIRRHRQMMKSYRELYKTKITSKKPSEELLKALEVGQCWNRILVSLYCHKTLTASYDIMRRRDFFLFYCCQFLDLVKASIQK